MKRPLLAVSAIALACLGAASAAGLSDTAGCVTNTTPPHTVAVDGTGVSTVPGASATACPVTVTTTVTVGGTTTTTPTTTVTPTTTTTTPQPALLFDDEFNGAAGAQPDPTKWVTFGNVCPGSSNWSESCIKKANAFQNGQGQLVLRVTNGTQGRKYDGAEISPSFLSGYPPNHNPSALYKYGPGSRLEARIKFAPGAGLWETLWSVSPDTNTANYLELDTQEWRGALPAQDTCHTHGILEYGSSINQGFDGSAGWHTYWQNYYPDHVTWGVDSQTCGSTPIPASRQESFILWNMVGPPGSWGGTGGPPPASDIPADMLVDYVRVTALG